MSFDQSRLVNLAFEYDSVDIREIGLHGNGIVVLLGCNPRKNESHGRINLVPVHSLSTPDQIKKDNEGQTTEGERHPWPNIELYGGFNTIRLCSSPHRLFSASALDTGEIAVHNLSPLVAAIESGSCDSNLQNSPESEIIRVHGFTSSDALAWQESINDFQLLSGDRAGHIYLSDIDPSLSISSNSLPFIGHTVPVQALKFSPHSTHEFASSSSDGTIRLWDTRLASRRSVLGIRVSSFQATDLSWCPDSGSAHLLAVGSDNGFVSAWDTRVWEGYRGQDPPAISNQPPPAAWQTEGKVKSVEWQRKTNRVAVMLTDRAQIWEVGAEMREQGSEDPIRRVKRLSDRQVDGVVGCRWVDGGLVVAANRSIEYIE